ncbi:hypothetical protein B0T22DRAFT_81849 [Podospora appendiculata]|uniref:Uncharacterized protein n=1 Tax=Podospora appendiculata TaxID=314037 RepID=A0AAE0XKF8_9PEZI|nr:hypothetical protein B0T22DRAFT_81849 [Podospora appendiculata]
MAMLRHCGHDEWRRGKQSSSTERGAWRTYNRHLSNHTIHICWSLLGLAASFVNSRYNTPILGVNTIRLELLRRRSKVFMFNRRGVLDGLGWRKVSYKRRSILLHFFSSSCLLCFRFYLHVLVFDLEGSGFGVRASWSLMEFIIVERVGVTIDHAGVLYSFS